MIVRKLRRNITSPRSLVSKCLATEYYTVIYNHSLLRVYYSKKIISCQSRKDVPEGLINKRWLGNSHPVGIGLLRVAIGGRDEPPVTLLAIAPAISRDLFEIYFDKNIAITRHSLNMPTC